jgi:hypothetical protein
MTYTLAVIPCTGQKNPDLQEAPAEEIWTGNHFQLTLAYTELFFDRVMVMSYKYGLIEPSTVIQTYDIDMRVEKARARIRWWYLLKGQIDKMADEDPPSLVGLFTGSFERDRVIREFVKHGVDQVIVPWEGKGIGQRQAAVYDAEPPFEPDKVKEGKYKVELNADGLVATNRYLPPPTKITGEIEWE